MVIDEILKPVVKSHQFPQMLDKLNSVWQEEQVRRQAFYNWVTPNIKAEFIEGEIVVHSPVQLKHNKISKRILFLLDLFVEKLELGFVGIEKIMIRLTRNDYEPDILFFENAKSQNFKESQTLFPAPDFIVEVLSPSTEEKDRGIKFRDYAQHGVREYWIIDPETEIVEQYILDDDEYVLKNKLKKGMIESVVIEGFKIPVRAIFDPKENLKALQNL
jgi:Uma2 family endonuclease